MAWRLSDDLGIYEINERWNSTNIQDGIVKTDNNSPELDSLTGVINNTEELDIKIRDIVGLNDHISDEDVFYIVATYDKESATTSNGSHTYKYTLNLVSPTKLFETIVLPNTANTNVGQNLTIKEFLIDKFNCYMPIQFDGIQNSNAEIAWDFPDGLGDMVCPEFVLGECTMRELLNYLWAIKNCTFQCKIKDISHGSFQYAYVISYLDYNKRGDQLHTEDMIIKESNTIENNATHLKSNLGNTIDSELTNELCTMRPSGYLFENDQLKIILNKSINEMRDFKICVKIRRYYGQWASGGVYVSGGSVVFECKYNANDYIFEKKIYDGLDVMKAAGSSGATSGWTYPCKNAACYWERGKNIIDGLLYPTSGWFGWSTDYALTYILNHIPSSSAEEAKLISGSGTPNWNTATFDRAPAGYNWCSDNGTAGNYYYLESSVPDGIFFDITYKGYTNQTTLLIEQSNNINNRKAALISNQNDSMVVPSKFAVQSLEKVNQMGNNQRLFVGMTKKLARIPKIADYDGDYTVTNVQYKITNGIYEYVGYMSKNFVNTALYALLEKQRRYTALASQDEALQRDEVLPLKVNINLSNSHSSSGLNYSTKVRWCVACVGWTSATASNEYLIIPAKTLFAGNMISYSMAFVDNVSGGKYKGSSVISGTETYPAKELKYVDSNGEFKGVKCTWYKDLVLEHYIGDDAYAHTIDSLNALPDRILYRGASVVDDDSLANDDGGYIKLFYNYFKFRKDNREKITLTTELIFKANNDKIIVGNNFANFFIASGIGIWKRTRAFTYIDQIVNTAECEFISYSEFRMLAVPTTTTIKNAIANDNYNSFYFNISNKNIAFVGPDNELLFAINNYNGEYISFGTPNTSIVNNTPDYYLAQVLNPIAEEWINQGEESDEWFIDITNPNAETCDYFLEIYGEYGYEELDRGTITAGNTIRLYYNMSIYTNARVRLRYNGIYSDYVQVQ